MSLAMGQVWHMPAINYVRHNLDFVVVSSEKTFPPVEPILKWVGGKRSLLAELNKVIPDPNPGGTYFEPFLGAGAVLFSRTGSFKLVGYDTNKELVDTYSTVKNNLDELLTLLEEHAQRHSKEYFYEIRAWDRQGNWLSRTKIQRSARMIFLNKSCFNGMYRVNSEGKFNVPFGNYAKPIIADQLRLTEMSKFLKRKLPSRHARVSISNSDYTKVLQVAKEGDVVYFDPPYDPISASSSFTAYSKEGFDEFDQRNLFVLASKLVEIGVRVVMSNSASTGIKKLCDEFGFDYQEVSISRKLAAKSSSRKPIKELIITHM